MVIATDADFNMDSEDMNTAATVGVNPNYTGETTISIASIASTISSTAILIF